jgi:hypothetical protein
LLLEGRVTGVLALLLALSLTAETEPAVPLELQAELLSRVLKYDRQLPARAGERVKVLIVHDDTAVSVGVARRLETALAAQAQLGALPHDEQLVRFEGLAKLAALLREQRPAVVVLAPGLATHAEALARELDDEAMLTVTTGPAGVREGLVLGFDLVGGRPRMLVNLKQARRQHVDFRAEVLQLMTVFP